MPQIKRLELETIFNQVEIKANAYWMKQLKALGFSGRIVANFGCANGHETLALLSVLDVAEAIGIDKDISQANVMLSDLKAIIGETSMALPYASQEDYLWWKTNIPDFIKETRIPAFVEEKDVAHPFIPFQLQNDYFDLACCSNFLYQILENQGDEDVRKVVEEMVRVVKVGGWIVADEPDNGEPARFLSIFEDLKLEPVKVETNEYDTTYCFRKTSDT